MRELIKKFYEDNRTPGILINQKLTKFEQNADIASEFEYWIENRSYETEEPVAVEGYTAKKLSDESKYLEGEGAFMMLIELRENPEKALNQLSRGIKRK